MTATETWDAIYRDVSRSQRTWPSEDVIRFCSRRLPLGVTTRILEIGCGNGANTWFLTSQRYQVVATDVSAVALGHAQLVVKIRDAEGVPYVSFIHITEAGAEAFPPGSLLPPDHADYDAVIDCRVSQHLAWSKHAEAYQDYAKMLKPGGWLFLLHLDDETSDATMNEDAVKPEPHTWLDITRGVYPRCGLVCMPPWRSLAAVVTRAGLSVQRIEQVTRQTKHDGLVCSHTAIDAQKSFVR